MKTITFLIAYFTATALLAQNRVGINTQTPERTLEVNGNVRVSEFINKTDDPDYADLLIANQKGEVDQRSKASIILQDNQQVETVKNIYYSIKGGKIEKTVNCGKYEITIDHNDIPLFRLTKPIEKEITINYGLRRLEIRVNLTGGEGDSGNGDYFDSSFHQRFTSDNWNVYHPFYNTQERRMLNNDAYRLHIVDSETGDFYKIDLTRITNRPEDSGYAGIVNEKESGIRAIICERHFNIKN